MQISLKFTNFTKRITAHDFKMNFMKCIAGATSCAQPLPLTRRRHTVGGYEETKIGIIYLTKTVTTDWLLRRRRIRIQQGTRFRFIARDRPWSADNGTFPEEPCKRSSRCGRRPLTAIRTAAGSSQEPCEVRSRVERRRGGGRAGAS